MIVELAATLLMLVLLFLLFRKINSTMRNPITDHRPRLLREELETRRVVRPCPGCGIRIFKVDGWYVNP